MPILNLALQGGGSHGAFTWGVLDALLADRRIALEGVSGASAGAVNAVALASGWARAEAQGDDPREGARRALRGIWDEVAAWGALASWPGRLATPWAALVPGSATAAHLAQAWRQWLSPYQSNPLDLNPLRELLARQVDFAAVAAHPLLKVFVSATHVRTGKAVIFSGRDLRLEAVLASACLPLLFQAVEIDGHAYWDGGFSVNPPLSPLIDRCASADILLVQINAVEREAAPRSPQDIADRISELTFNASLLTQMRAIDFINRLIAEGALPEARCRTIRVHRIDGGAALRAYAPSTRSAPDAALIGRLFELGQEAGRQWIARHLDDLGQRSTIDLRRDYLDDTRLELPAAASPPARPRGFRPWLARLLRRRGP